MVKPRLAVGDVAAGQSVDPLSIETNQLLAPTHPTASQASKKPTAIGGSPPVGLRPPYGPLPMALSHPDSRCSLTLIVGDQLPVWRYDYNNVRPHSSLGNRTPAEARRAVELVGGSALGALATDSTKRYPQNRFTL